MARLKDRLDERRVVVALRADEERVVELSAALQAAPLFKDFVSGALIESVCTRAKKAAVKRLIATNVKGLTAADLVEAVKVEFRENEDLPNTTNPDDWAKIAGRRSERIVHVRPVFRQEKAGKTESVSTGHYAGRREPMAALGKQSGQDAGGRTGGITGTVRSGSFR